MNPNKPRGSGLAVAIATWFGCGYSPVAPGTAGSLAALLLAAAAVRWIGFGPLDFLVVSALLMPFGIWASDVTARVLDRKDPGLVVVDEVIGQWVTLAGATNLNWLSGVIGFLLFRLFDVWKPFPARRMEKWPGGLGIVADDVMAGFYAALVLNLAGWLNLY